MIAKLKTLMLGAVIASATLLTTPSAEAHGSDCGAQQAALNNAIQFLIQVRMSGEGNEALEDLAEDMVKQAFSAWSKCDMAR